MVRKLKSLLLKNDTVFQTVFKNTFWIGAGQIIGRLLRAALIIYAARVLGAAGYGAFSYALSLAGFFSIFSDIGITSLLTREGAKRPEAIGQYVATGFVIKSILMVFNTALIIAVLPFLSNIPETATLFPLIALVFIFDGIRDFSFAITRATEKMEIEAGVTILTNVAILVLGAASLFFFPSPITLMIAYAVGSGIGTAAITAKVWRYFSSIYTLFNRSLVKPIITEAWPFGVAGLLSSVMLTTDTIMLGWLRTSEELGFYGAAQRVILLLYLLPGFLNVSIFPSLSRFAENDRIRFGEIFRKVIRTALLIGIPIAVGGFLVAPALVRFLFGNEYEPATTTLQILLLTALLTFPGITIGNGLFAFQKQRFLVKTFFAGVIGNIIFNYFLIASYGIAGAAVATVITQFITITANAQYMKRLVQFSLFSHILRPIAASFGMAIAVSMCILFSFHVLIAIGVGGIVYGFILFAMREPLLITAITRFKEHFSSQITV